MASGHAPVKRKRRTNASSSAPVLPDGFISNKAAAIYQRLSLRKIVYGKIFDRKLFSSSGLMLDELFQKQGMIDFLCIDEKVYIDLLHQFFANLHHPTATDGSSDKSRIHSLVQNREIALSAPILRQIFNLPAHSHQSYTVTDKFDTYPQYSKDTALNQIKGLAYDSNRKLTAHMLNLNCRLIHHIVGYCILPRSGSRNHVSQLEIFLTWALLNSKKLDFADMILHHMSTVPKTKKSGVLYGMAFTRILQHFNINLDQETNVYKTTYNDKYSDQTLHLMGYTLIDKVWVPKDRCTISQQPQGPETGVEVEAEEEDGYDEEEDDAEEQPPQRTNNEIYDLLSELNNNVHTYRSELNEFRHEYQYEMGVIHSRQGAFLRDKYNQFPPTYPNP